MSAARASKSEINRAGDLLRDWWNHALDIREDDELLAAIATMSDFRETFQPALKKVTVGIRQFVQRETDGDIVVGQRLKRAPQIVRKLSRFPKMNLARMQDIGGCRAILSGGSRDVEGVLERIRKNGWDVRGSKNYVAEPAASGYRAIHVVVMRDERLIEIQLRTVPQHEWAEAVERTDLRLGFNLKDGQGPPDLLEYFRMAAIGIALEEQGQSVDSEFRREFLSLREKVRHHFERKT